MSVRSFASAFFSVAIFSLVLTALPSSSTAQTSTCTISHTLYRGASGPDVSCLQQGLITLGYLTPGSSTGYFGVLTEAAIQQLQIAKGIVYSGTPTTTGFGVAGPRTLEVFIAALIGLGSTLPPPTPTPSPFPSTCSVTRTLYRGLSGADVLCVQQVFVSLGYLSSESTTGYYGALTEVAVQRFQAAQNIISYGSPDTTGYGVLGPRTRTALLSSAPVSPPTPPTPTPTPSGSCGLDGVSLTSGATRAFYRSSTAPAGQTCASISQNRTCTNGSLSGPSDYAYAYCSETTLNSCSLSGVTIPNGTSITAYQSSSAPFGGICVFEPRTCTNGTLSGTYANTSCVIDAPLSCAIDGITIAHGASGTLYSKAGVTFGELCSTFAQTRTCTNGVLSGNATYIHSSCTVGQPLVCSFDGASVANGSSVTAYQSATVPFGSTCTSQSRTCSNGTLSGTYANSSCAVLPAASCTFNGLTVTNGSSVTAYQSATVPFGSTCTSQSRTCTNGVLSGTYTRNSCIVSPAASCVLDGLTTASGASATYYSQSSVAFGNVCASVASTRTCTNGVLSGASSYSKAACTVGLPPVDTIPVPGASADACGNWNEVAESSFTTTIPNFYIHTSGLQSVFDSLLRLLSGTHKLSSHVKGCVTEKEIWFSSANNYNYYSGSGNTSSIAVRIHPTTRLQTNTGVARSDVDSDKMMWQLRDSKTGGSISMGDTVYTAFAFKVAGDFSVPLHDKGLMIYQIWQGTPFSPPISMHINGDGVGDPTTQPLSLELRKNVGTLEDEDGAIQVLSSVPITRGVWVELIIGVRFDQIQGSFSIYKRNGDHFELVAQQSGLRTALDPTVSKIKGGATYYPNDRAATSFGLYRTRQQADQTVFFDEIRVGPTYASVLLPEPAP